MIPSWDFEIRGWLPMNSGNPMVILAGFAEMLLVGSLVVLVYCLGILDGSMDEFYLADGCK